MYSPGNIIYYTPFYFPDGGCPKNKYFIVIKEEPGTVLIAGLPTRKDSVPASIEKIHGCINDETINFNCYFFEQNRAIASNGWGFPEATHLYGFRLAYFSRSQFDGIYKIEGVDYVIIGQLTEQEYVALVDCMKNSKSVPRKIRRALGSNI